jgi:D-glycero-D-manno-heptose 1,7-bisphosphate phosphatase
VNRAVFLDRDGVINRKAPEGRYITCLEEWVFLPEVAPAIASLNHAGFSVIVVSNQRCVAKGLVSAHELDLMHQWMCRTLAASGAIVDHVYYCPHEKQPPCSCRKPAPGMLFTAAQEHQIDLAASWMIGDSDSDVEAGRNAGCKTARLLEQDEVESGKADLYAGSLLDAVQQILLLQVTPRRRERGQLDYRRSHGLSSSRVDRV